MAPALRLVRLLWIEDDESAGAIRYRLLAARFSADGRNWRPEGHLYGAGESHVLGGFA